MGYLSLIDPLKQKFASILPSLNERARRLAVAAEAKALGHGGVARVALASGISESTIRRGLKELRTPGRRMNPEKVRKPGGGRKRLVEQDVRLLSDLESLVEPVVRGDPESPLRWILKSLRALADALNSKGHTVSHATVGVLLHQAGYSLQTNRKTQEGNQHSDRNAQFEFIYKEVGRHQAMGQPVISVDTKKKDLVGNFKNGGRERQKWEPRRVRVHDLLIQGQGEDILCGEYDLTWDEGWEKVGIDQDTAAFAVESIRRW